MLDEPTAALDYGNAMRVVEKIGELAERGYAVLMTTHSPDHAFMLDSNVVLLQKSRPMQFGRAQDVITERNMRDAYGVNVETKEFLTRDGGVVRMCASVVKRHVCVQDEEEKGRIMLEKKQVDSAKATRDDAEVLVGSSPRGGIALRDLSRSLALSQGSGYVLPDDVKALAPCVLCHRIILSHEAKSARRSPDDVIASVLGGISVPVVDTEVLGDSVVVK